VIVLDQFGAKLGDHTDDVYAVSPYLTAYRDMVPELFRLLGDTAKADAEIYAKKVAAALPLYYVSFAPADMGNEHNLTHPIDGFQMFMEQSILERVPSDTLVKRVDVPWTSVGDLFYMQKLAETIRAYQGWSWSR
jgi:hypothetical protein